MQLTEIAKFSPITESGAPVIGADCHQLSQGQIPIAVITTLNNEIIACNSTHVVKNDSKQGTIGIPVWFVGSVETYNQRFWSTAKATIVLSTALKDPYKPTPYLVYYEDIWNELGGIKPLDLLEGDKVKADKDVTDAEKKVTDAEKKVSDTIKAGGEKPTAEQKKVIEDAKGELTKIQTNLKTAQENQTRINKEIEEEKQKTTKKEQEKENKKQEIDKTKKQETNNKKTDNPVTPKKTDNPVTPKRKLPVFNPSKDTQPRDSSYIPRTTDPIVFIDNDLSASDIAQNPEVVGDGIIGWSGNISNTTQNYPNNAQSATTNPFISEFDGGSDPNSSTPSNSGRIEVNWDGSDPSTPPQSNYSIADNSIFEANWNDSSPSSERINIGETDNNQNLVLTQNNISSTNQLISPSNTSIFDLVNTGVVTDASTGSLPPVPVEGLEVAGRLVPSIGRPGEYRPIPGIQNRGSTARVDRILQYVKRNNIKAAAEEIRRLVYEGVTVVNSGTVEYAADRIAVKHSIERPPKYRVVILGASATQTEEINKLVWGSSYNPQARLDISRRVYSYNKLTDNRNRDTQLPGDYSFRNIEQAAKNAVLVYEGNSGHTIPNTTNSSLPPAPLPSAPPVEQNSGVLSTIGNTIDNALVPPVSAEEIPPGSEQYTQPGKTPTPTKLPTQREAFTNATVEEEVIPLSLSRTITPETEIVIYLGYINALKINSTQSPEYYKDLIKENKVLRVFMGSIDTVTSVTTGAGTNLMIECRDRVKYLMDTVVTLDPTFSQVGDAATNQLQRIFSNSLDTSQTSQNYYRSSLIYQLSNYGVGHIVVYEETIQGQISYELECNTNGLAFVRGDIYDFGLSYAAASAPATVAGYTDADGIAKEEALNAAVTAAEAAVETAKTGADEAKTAATKVLETAKAKLEEFTKEKETAIETARTAAKDAVTGATAKTQELKEKLKAAEDARDKALEGVTNQPSGTPSITDEERTKLLKDIADAKAELEEHLKNNPDAGSTSPGLVPDADKSAFVGFPSHNIFYQVDPSGASSFKQTSEKNAGYTGPYQNLSRLGARTHNIPINIKEDHDRAYNNSLLKGSTSLGVVLKVPWNILTARLPYTNNLQGLQNHFIVDNQVPLDGIKFISAQEPYPTEVFMNHMDGELYYTPIANDYSGFGDKRRFYRTYYLNPIQTETKSVNPNTVALKYKEEFSSLGMKTNFLISKTGPGVTSAETSSLNLHLAIRPAYLRGKPIAGRNMYISDPSISTPQEAAAIALQMGQLYSKETRTATLSLLGDPTMTPGEALQLRNSPLLRVDTTSSALTTHKYDYEKDKCAYVQWELSKIYCWAEILDKIRISGGIINETAAIARSTSTNIFGTPVVNDPNALYATATQPNTPSAGADSLTGGSSNNNYSGQVSNETKPSLTTENPTDDEIAGCTDYVVKGSAPDMPNHPKININVNEAVGDQASALTRPTPANYYCGVSKGQTTPASNAANAAVNSSTQPTSGNESEPPSNKPKANDPEYDKLVQKAKEAADIYYDSSSPKYDDTKANDSPHNVKANEIFEATQAADKAVKNYEKVHPELKKSENPPDQQDPQQNPPDQQDPQQNNTLPETINAEALASSDTAPMSLGSLVVGATNPRSSSYRQEPRTIWRVQAVKHKFNAAGTQGFETEVILTSPF